MADHGGARTPIDAWWRLRKWMREPAMPLQNAQEQP